MARDLKFRIWKAEVLYYPNDENKGADQLRGDREADLRLCFRICKNPVFSRRGPFYSLSQYHLSRHVPCAWTFQVDPSLFIEHKIMRK